jgi:hypothetical protein
MPGPPTLTSNLTPLVVRRSRLVDMPGIHSVIGRGVQDRAMGQPLRRTTDVQAARLESLHDREGSISALAPSVAAITSGATQSATGGIQAPIRNGASPDVPLTTAPVWDQVQAVRRRLWILSAKLDSLPAKIELAIHNTSDRAHETGSDQVRRRASALRARWLGPHSEGFVGNWWARMRLARLRLQADQAERRATDAIQHASASFGAAFEAVLQAAVARVKSDEARLSSRRTSNSRSHV